MSYIPLLVF